MVLGFDAYFQVGNGVTFLRDHLKLLRVGAHMIQDELSKKLHIHQTTYSAYGQGNYNSDFHFSQAVLEYIKLK